MEENLITFSKEFFIAYIREMRNYIDFLTIEQLTDMFNSKWSSYRGYNQLKKSEVKLLVEDAISNKITDIDGLYNITINRFVSDCASGFLKTDLSLSEDSVYPSYEYYSDINPTKSGLNNIFEYGTKEGCNSNSLRGSLIEYIVENDIYKSKSFRNKLEENNINFEDYKSNLLEKENNSSLHTYKESSSENDILFSCHSDSNKNSEIVSDLLVKLEETRSEKNLTIKKEEYEKALELYNIEKDLITKLKSLL